MTFTEINPVNSSHSSFWKLANLESYAAFAKSASILSRIFSSWNYQMPDLSIPEFCLMLGVLWLILRIDESKTTFCGLGILGVLVPLSVRRMHNASCLVPTCFLTLVNNVIFRFYWNVGWLGLRNNKWQRHVLGAGRMLLGRFQNERCKNSQQWVHSYTNK